MYTSSIEVNKEAPGRKMRTGAIVAIIAVFCAVCLGVMAYALVTTRVKTEKFVPPPFDAEALTGTPDVPDAESLGWKELDAQAYKFSVCGVFAVENSKADVWLTNPEGNAVWLKLRVLNTNGDTLGETGLVRPGEYVKQVALNAQPSDGDSVQLKVMAYEPDTYYSAGVVSLNTTVKGDTP